MKKNIFLLTFLLLLSSMAIAQNQKNVSLQVGYQIKLVNPRPLNAIVDSFHFYNPALSQRMDEFRWNTGFFAAIGFHPGRSHFRLQAMSYGGHGTAVGPDGSGTITRHDLGLFGGSISGGFTSELFEVWPESHICIGAQFNMNYLEVSYAAVPNDSYEKDDPLPDVLTNWKPSFTIHTPLRIGIGPQVKLSIEPYYQIYFGPTNFQPVNEALNPATFENTPVNVREGDLDNFGVNAAVIVFLRPN